MFERAGEDAGGSMFSRCPGDESCDIWTAAAGDYDYKIKTKVCDGCTRCGGNPPKPPDAPATDDELTPEEMDEIIDDVEDIVRWQRAGYATDESCYSFAINWLVTQWFAALDEIENLRAVRMQSFLKAWMKQT